MQIVASIVLGACVLLVPTLAGASAAGEASKSVRVEEPVQNPASKTPDGQDPTVWLPEVSGGFGIPELSIRGFGHLQFDLMRENLDPGPTDTNNNFANGGLDLTISSQIGDRVDFLNETVFEFGAGGENILDVERVQLKYEHADWLRLSIGRGHSALGFWNQKYHHGTWMFTTSDRPIIYRFEDDGGILPVHFVGIEASGRMDAGPGALSYVATVANGRGRITDSVQLVEDANDSKAVALMLRYEPEALPGFGLGASLTNDRIPSNPAVAGRGRSIPELIYGFHAYYLQGPLELLGEALFVRHRDRTLRDTQRSNGGYGQLAYAFGKVKPYYRFDWLQIDEIDPFFANLDEVEDQTQHTLGVRYEWRTFAAIKVEYRHTDADSVTIDAATAQISFAF